MLILLSKSFVAEHLRYLKSGKSVRVQSHYTKRVKKHTEHALAHNHNLDHLSDKDKDLFNRMHAEQHLAEFYDGHALRKRVAHHETEATKHNDHADELGKQGKHKEAAAARRKANKHTVAMHRHKADLKKVDKVVHGIAALKERLVAGSGKLEGDAESIHQHYVSKIGERLKPLPEAKEAQETKVLFAAPQPAPNAKAIAAAEAALSASKGVRRVKASYQSGGGLMSFDDWVEDILGLHTGLMSPTQLAEAKAAYNDAISNSSAKAKKAVLSESAAQAKLSTVKQGGVALKGTPKQREWAEKIRQNCLNGLSPEQAAIAVNPDGLFTNAKWWIETRNMDVKKLGAFFLAQKKLLALCKRLRDENKKDEYAKAAEIYNGLTGQFGFGTANAGTDYLRLAQDHLRQAGIN